ncbi:serine hydrolase domain-containing protein [Robiginitalea biformata]|uniref:Putative beta-lactamase n=1 Tax=Robiginitalea biformata (strain ATCC BAA-864 / DSM 15991 / KCTC 12146 / HTCC2501) TaxID=313596 RepID=A4CKX2_ROBBH|nr:serine hydrolase domain-containing protein [Robiginitalea biformata]EAR15521.1 putative beta-lactamase precursor [Robiginitalea biformata HTCC2501]
MWRIKIAVFITFLILILGVSLGTSGPVEGRKTGKAGEESAARREGYKPREGFNQMEAVRFRKSRKEIAEAVRRYFQEALASGDIVGAGVSIVLGDSVLLSDGYGLRNSNHPDPVDARTVFRLGSLSKGFAGILAANLADQQLLSPEDPVIRYIPEFRFGDAGHTRGVNLGHLLTHTSGAPYHSYTNLVEAGLDLTEIAGRFDEVSPIGKPGSVYSYQNALFALSGEIMERVTGQPLGRLLEERFFKPLEMCATGTDHESLLKAVNIALPHTKRRKGWRPRKLTDNYYNAIAAGGINASALDMAQWMHLLLGRYPEILSEGARQIAFNPRVEIPGRSKYYQRWPGHVSSHYGFGWRIHKFREKGSGQLQTMVHHGGSVNGFRNEIALYPESELGICVLLNSHSRLASHVIPDLYEIVRDIHYCADSHLALNN